MLPSLNRPAVYIGIAGSLLLLFIGCSSGDLSRSEAKKKLSKTVDMCNPCFIVVDADNHLGAKLIQFGYVERSTLQLTPLGQRTLGDNAVSHPSNLGPNMFMVAAFKKEIDEVTGVAVTPTGTADVTFTYRVVPLIDVIRDDSLIGLYTISERNFFNLREMGTLEKDGDKLVAFHTTGKAKFKKYDDGWRIERGNRYKTSADLDITGLGGWDRSLFDHL